MTLPLSGSISISAIRTELALGSDLNLGHIDVRDLASLATGQIRMSDLYGRQYNTNDSVPRAFSFPNVDNAALSTSYTSQVILSGTNVDASVSCSNCLISINGGPYVTSGVASPGATLTVQITSASNYNTVRSGTVSISGVVGAFSVATNTEYPGLLNFILKGTSTTGTVVGGTITGNSAIANQGGPCVAFGVSATQIPKDGLWYYYESTGTEYSGWGMQSTAQASTGTYAGSSILGRRIAWRFTSTAWLCKVYSEGATTATLFDSYIPVSSNVYAGLHVGGLIFSNFLPYASQWQGPIPTDIVAHAIVAG